VPKARAARNRLLGCPAAAWLAAETDADCRLRFRGAGGSVIIEDPPALLPRVYFGQRPEESSENGSGFLLLFGHDKHLSVHRHPRSGRARTTSGA
jgi:sulfur transfer protein SufE